MRQLSSFHLSVLLHESQGQQQTNLKSSLLAQLQLEWRIFSSATPYSLSTDERFRRFAASFLYNSSVEHFLKQVIFLFDVIY